jgi:hypothetical protein
MSRRTVLALLAVLALHASPSHAETRFGFQIGISGGSAPPLVFTSEPRYVVVNEVRVIRDDRCDDDVFMADRAYWRMHDGYWYRSGSWRGPWVVVDVRRVPERVLVVPARYWRHHPKHRDKGRTVVVVRDHDDDHGRGRGRGRGRGGYRDRHRDHD